MKQRPRIYYSETDKALMWDRWQKGDSLHAIARSFDRSLSSFRYGGPEMDTATLNDWLQIPGLFAVVGSL